MAVLNGYVGAGCLISVSELERKKQLARLAIGARGEIQNFLD